MKWMITATVVLTLVGATGASAQRADDKVEPPISRSANWFAYVGANDIRQGCTPGGRNRLRLIYNALYEEQVRTYEIFLQPDAGQPAGGPTAGPDGAAPKQDDVVEADYEIVDEKK